MHGRVFFVLLAVAFASPSPALDGAKYLIVTPDSFVDAARPLADWKTSKGVLARIVPTSLTGSDTAQIRNYILDAYDNWEIPPEYVLLLGAPACIPSQGGNNDCYYGDMSGDYLMEIPVGRLPALTIRECSTMVNKVLAYENPPSGTDSTWFIKGTTVVREDYPPDSFYQPDARQLRQYWSDSSYLLAESLSDFQGHNSSHVTAAANDGRAFITYRGTGVGVWYAPFGAIDPFTWTNGAKLPVVVGATCQTVTLFPGESMYGDKFVRAGTPLGLAGAVAYFGTSRAASSVSRYRSACYRGFFRALYEEGVTRLGTATLRGRFRIDSLYRVQIRYTEWTLLGDPEMNVWTAVPRRLSVAHDSTMPMEPGPFTVTVTAGGAPVAEAQVCAWMDSTVFSCETTDADGRVVLYVDPSHPGSMSVVVTGRNLRPYVGTCGVILTDVACTEVSHSIAVADSGVAVTPTCFCENFGNRTVGYKVRLALGDSYIDSAVVTGHRPGTQRAVSFSEWTPRTRGSFGLRCTTMLDLDQRTDNDLLACSAFVRVRDAGVASVESPEGTYVPGSVVMPRAVWRNHGNVASTVRAVVSLLEGAGVRVYRQSCTLIDLPPGADTTIGGFPACTLATRGLWTVRCSTYLPYDARPENDVVVQRFVVGAEWQPGWSASAPMPTAPSGKAVKDGGWMTVDPGPGAIYAGKGYKTADFYRYDATADTWQQLAAIPAGVEEKLPGKGAAGTTDGSGSIYLVKGNNTSAFWKYRPAADSWYPLAGVPLGPSGKKLRGGSDLVYVDVAGLGYLYLLKGYLNEFWRYDIAAGSWQQMAVAPVGANQKWDKGSWLACDASAGIIYAHKAKYHEFYAYDVAGNSWSAALSPMPLPGANGKKKAKVGSSGFYSDGSVYALKGGNTQEFWQYTAATNAWRELDTLPRGVGRKKVKDGADLVGYSEGILFALKGNKTSELWRYVAWPGAYSPSPARDGALAGVERLASGVMRISPNPVSGGYATISMGAPGSTPARVQVVDISGRALYSSFVLRTSSLRLDLRSLPPGVYFVELRGADRAETRKVVIE